MTIKVCGMREPENIRAVEELGVDMIGFIFVPQSKRYVQMISSNAGILPDHADNSQKLTATDNSNTALRVGVFVDDMPQNIITRIYNYSLDYVQLHGNESAVMIDNLRRSVDPDIHKGLKIIKAISVANENDVKRWREYKGHADMLLFDTKGNEPGGNGRHFDWSLLDAYDGNIPFLLSGGIDIDDAVEIRKIKHPMFAGVDINSRFETEPAVKDVDKIRKFIRLLKDD